MADSSILLDCIDGTVESGALSKEYDQEIFDDKGNTVRESVINGKHLSLYTTAPPENNTVYTTSRVDGICMPVSDTLRLIMHIANIVQFSGALDERDNEILRAIEVIARRGIR